MPTTTGFVQQQCLIAMPGMSDSCFEKAVIYMLEHNSDGAFGLIINKPLDIAIDEVLAQINLHYEAETHPQPVCIGGPVDSHRGFVLHRPGHTEWEQQVTVNENLAITSSSDILQAMSNGQDIGEYMIILGYSGWGPNQLEQEIADNAWLTVDIPVTTLLSTPMEERLPTALKVLGITYAQLSNHAGHA